jgi:hypothetical protein
VPKAELIGASTDRASPIATVDDLIEWVDAAQGRGFGWAQKRS